MWLGSDYYDFQEFSPKVLITVIYKSFLKKMRHTFISFEENRRNFTRVTTLLIIGTLNSARVKSFNGHVNQCKSHRKISKHVFLILNNGMLTFLICCL